MNSTGVTGGQCCIVQPARPYFPFQSSLALILRFCQKRPTFVCEGLEDEAMSMLRFDGRVALVTGAGGGN